MFKPISISFAPNFEKDDTVLAIKLLLGMVSHSKLNSSMTVFQKEFSDYFGGRHVSLFSSGRAGLCYALKSLNLEHEDEVIIQAFTCVAVPDAVLWAGLKPIFADIDKQSYNFDLKDLKKKISKKTRVIIIQHTFGIPAQMDEIKAIAKKFDLYLIEDCAHSLGGMYKKEKFGTIGDLAVFSFGRDKMISCVYGGAVITNSNKIKNSLLQQEKTLVMPPISFIRQQLYYLIIYVISLPFYNIFLGKLFLWFAGKFELLSRAVYKKELYGERPSFLAYHLSPYFAPLLLQQFRKLSRFNKHRKNLSRFYIENLKLDLEPLPYIRIPVKVGDKNKVLLLAKKKGIHLGNWYRGPIDPPESNNAVFDYKKCITAEHLGEHTINLPTHINTALSDALKIVNFLKEIKYEKS